MKYLYYAISAFCLIGTILAIKLAYANDTGMFWIGMIFLNLTGAIVSYLFATEVKNGN